MVPIPRSSTWDTLEKIRIRYAVKIHRQLCRSIVRIYRKGDIEKCMSSSENQAAPQRHLPLVKSPCSFMHAGIIPGIQGNRVTIMCAGILLRRYFGIAKFLSVLSVFIGM